MIRKLVLTVAMVSMSMFFVVQNSISAEPDPIDKQYMDLLYKWIEFNNWDKDKAYAAIGDIGEQVRATFPMDPNLEQQRIDFVAAFEAKLEVKAKALGFENLKQAIDARYSENPSDAVVALYDEWNENIEQSYRITDPYTKEFNRRYALASIEAINRLFENANTMK